MLKVKYVLTILTGIILLAPTVAIADGMVIPRPDYYIWETEQKAVIFYENDKEDLYVSTTFTGDSADFAWVIPTPAVPEVDKGYDDLFNGLNDFTTPIYDYDRPMPLMEDKAIYSEQAGVNVIATKRVDYYEINVLSASDINSLEKWFKANGYNYPSAGKYILDEYIRNGWYFTAVKVIDEEAALSSAIIEGQLRSGHATPLKLSFATDKLVYPLRISSVTGNDEKAARRYYPTYEAGVLLYVITDKRVELPLFVTQYAGWINKEQLEKLAYDNQGEPILNPAGEKYFLTKLFRYMSKSEMTSDLYLRAAENNDTVNAPGEMVERGTTGFIIVMGLGGVLLIALLVVLFVSGRKRD